MLQLLPLCPEEVVFLEVLSVVKHAHLVFFYGLLDGIWENRVTFFVILQTLEYRPPPSMMFKKRNNQLLIITSAYESLIKLKITPFKIECYIIFFVYKPE